MMSLLRKLTGRPSCADIMEVLQSYLDGETDAATARRVARHLDNCTNCERESQVYESIKTSLAVRRRDVDPAILESLRRFGENLDAVE
jgi:anti-sigma factor (TIGR02949 family)